MDSELLNLRKKRFVTDPAETILPAAETNGYQAFAFEAHAQRRLRILCKDGINHSMAYMNLVDIIDNGPVFTRLALVFSHYVYRCEGRNHQQLVELLSEEKVKRIVEFDPGRWQWKPADGDAIITKVEIRLRTDPSLADILGAPKPGNGLATAAG